jgi:hypothetical protein
LIWQIWYEQLSPELQQNTPPDLPSGWQKVPSIADEIIRKCPFSVSCDNATMPRIGNLEHLHVYCSSPIL